MEKRSRGAKEKTQSRHDGSGPRKEHHKQGVGERLAIKPSWRPHDNYTENFTLLNIKHADILQEVYHLKLISKPTRSKRFNVVLGNDRDAWCSYHRMRGHHT